MFDSFDENQNGIIDASELANALRHYKCVLSSSSQLPNTHNAQPSSWRTRHRCPSTQIRCANTPFPPIRAMLTTQKQGHLHRTARVPHKSNWTGSYARASSSSRCARCMTASARGASGPCPSAATISSSRFCASREKPAPPFHPFSQPRNAEGERKGGQFELGLFRYHKRYTLL